MGEALGKVLSTLILAVLVGWPMPGRADPIPSAFLLAASKTDHTLAIVDPQSLKVLAKMPLGPDPHEVAVSDDGKTAYVSNMGNITYHEIDVLDLTTRKALKPIDTWPLTGPHGLQFAGGKLWFTAQGAKSVARFDPGTQKVEWIMGTGQFWTHMLVVSRDLKTLYASNVGSGTLTSLQQQLVPPLTTALGYVRPGRLPVIDWVATVIPTAEGNEGLDLSPDEREVWTASPVTGQIFVVDTGTRKVARTIDAHIVGANRLKFTHDGSRVLISNFRNGELVVYDARKKVELARLKTSSGASGILVAPDDARAFVACTFDNYVAVVDLRTFRVVDRIDIGGGPDGLAWAVRK